jgi:ankyrin repeat protein
MKDNANIFDLAVQDDPALLRSILPNGKPVTDIRTRDGVSLLLFCCYRGLERNRQALLEIAPDLPLHEAVALGRTERVHEILRQDPWTANTLSTDGWTPLHLAAFFHQNLILYMLIEHGADAGMFARAVEQNLPLHAACGSGNQEAALALVPLTPDLNIPQAQGWTPLHLAAAHGMEPVVIEMLKAGADRTLNNREGRTARYVAEAAGHGAVARLLGGK